jgi:hypothetical protein
MKMNGKNVTSSQSLAGHGSDNISDRARMGIDKACMWLLSLTAEQRNYYRQHPDERKAAIGVAKESDKRTWMERLSMGKFKRK